MTLIQRRVEPLYKERGNSVMTTGVAKIAAKAREDKKIVFTSIAHHITESRLWECLNKIQPSTATGIDGQDVRTSKDEFKNL